MIKEEKDLEIIFLEDTVFGTYALGNALKCFDGYSKE